MDFFFQLFKGAPDYLSFIMMTLKPSCAVGVDEVDAEGGAGVPDEELFETVELDVV